MGIGAIIRGSTRQVMVAWAKCCENCEHKYTLSWTSNKMMSERIIPWWLNAY